MGRHVIKFKYNEGVKLPQPEYWCGKTDNGLGWHFLNAQHAALAAGGSVPVCKNCAKAIIKALEQEI